MTVAGKAPIVAGPSRGPSRLRFAHFRMDDEFPGIAKYVFGHSLCDISPNPVRSETNDLCKCNDMTLT